MGQFVGLSEEHLSQVRLIRNLKTQWISPQYNVVYDNKFEVVTSTKRRWKHDVHTDNDSCTELFENRRDQYIEDEVYEKGMHLSIPELRN